MTTKQINSDIILFSLFFIWLYYFFLFHNSFPLFSFSVVPNGVSKINVNNVIILYFYKVIVNVLNKALKIKPIKNYILSIYLKYD
jgi:hypothetical protein